MEDRKDAPCQRLSNDILRPVPAMLRAGVWTVNELVKVSMTLLAVKSKNAETSEAKETGARP